MGKIRMGVVGLGHRGRAMFQWVSKGIEGIEGVAVCDCNPDLFYQEVTFCSGGRKPALANEMPGVKFYADYDEMLASADLQIVMVETPADCHAEFCAKALARGIHVYSDIPSVGSLADAAMLWQAQLSSEAMLMTGATTMGWGFVLALQQLVQKGLLGKPYYLEAEYIHDCRELWEETPWRKPGPGNPRHPITYCTHSLGPLLSILEEDLRYVVCLSTGSKVTAIAEAEDLMVALYQTESGVLLKQTASFINSWKAGNHSLRVLGTEGSFEHLAQRGNQPARTFYNSRLAYGMDRPTELPIGVTPREIEEISRKNSAALFGHGGADAYLWQLFANTLQQGGKTAPITLRQGLCMTLPGIYARASAKRGGQKIKILYPWDDDFQAEL